MGQLDGANVMLGKALCVTRYDGRCELFSGSMLPVCAAVVAPDVPRTGLAFQGK